MNPNSSDCNTEFSLSSTKKSDSTKKADLKERVSNTLNMRRHKKKQLATVKPIKGQLISECLKCHRFSKETTKNLTNFCPRI